MEIDNTCANVLHYDIDFDSTNPAETISNFIGAIVEMNTRFEANKVRIKEIEQELNDLCHYVEIASFKTVPNGYKLYRKIAELRRERRACKNENDLLQLVYQNFHGTDILTNFSNLHGELTRKKEEIDARTYIVRTDILDEWIAPPETKKPEPEEPIEDILDMDLTIEPPEIVENDDGTVTTVVNVSVTPEDILDELDEYEDLPTVERVPKKSKRSVNKDKYKYKRAWVSGELVNH